MKIKLILTIFIFAFILFGCTQQEVIQEQPIQKEYEQTIVAFGDSLTEGLGLPDNESYPGLLQKKLDALGYKIKVHNSGYSGETSSAAVNRVDWVMRLNPDIVILVIGANDAMRGIDLAITKKNIESIINQLNEKNVTVILGGLEIYKNLGPDYSKNFEQMYVDIAKQNDVIFIESFLGRVAGNSTLNQRDEIHPTKQGYEIIIEESIMPVLENYIE